MLFFEACYRSLCMFIYYCLHSTSFRLLKWSWKAWGLTSTGLMSCFNLQKRTSKGSSWVTFPTPFQQRVSDSCWKTDCLGWEEEVICTLTPPVLDLSVDNSHKVSFLTAAVTEPFCDRDTHPGWNHQLISSKPLSSYQKVSTFWLLEQLLWFWTSGLLVTGSDILLPIPKPSSSSEHMHAQKTITYKCKWLWSAKW